MAKLASYRSLRLEKIVALSELLGYSIEQIYTEYMKKNAINMERLKNGY
nr:MAG TPA: dUTPase [Bacteriophage sp.]